MVFNRLCDPDSKLGVLRWLETVAMPGLELKAITHQQLLRSKWLFHVTVVSGEHALPTQWR